MAASDLPHCAQPMAAFLDLPASIPAASAYLPDALACCPASSRAVPALNLASADSGSALHAAS